MPRGEKAKLLWKDPNFRKKISEAHKGHKMSESQVKELSKRVKKEWRTGKRKGGWHHKLSKETKIKQGLAKLGKKNPQWQGGVTKKHYLERKRATTELRLWRKAVFERDNHSCQKCGASGKLTVHHIRNFVSYPGLRTSIENGITFCKKCHQRFHRKYGIKNNNSKQIKEFINYA